MALLNEKTVPIGLRRTLSEAPARHWRAAGAALAGCRLFAGCPLVERTNGADDERAARQRRAGR